MVYHIVYKHNRVRFHQILEVTSKRVSRGEQAQRNRTRASGRHGRHARPRGYSTEDGGWPASKAYSRETGDAERANAQRVAQRLGKDNPEVFIPCRHVYTKFGACASQNFLPDAVRTRTRLGHSRDAMRPPHVTPRAQGARDPPHHDMGRLPCHGDHAQNCTAAPARVRLHTTGTANTPSDDTHKHWQTTAAPTHTSLLQWVPGHGSTQGTQDISPEPLTPNIPALPHAAGRSACRAARGAPAGTERLVTPAVT